MLAGLVNKAKGATMNVNQLAVLQVVRWKNGMINKQSKKTEQSGQQTVVDGVGLDEASVALLQLQQFTILGQLSVGCALVRCLFLIWLLCAFLAEGAN
jgi:hypothetical protein